MKITTLQKALDHYLTSDECKETKETLHVLEAIKELAVVRDHMEEDDVWRGSVQVINTRQLTDLLGMSTYDIYGKLARLHVGEVPFEDYAFQCNQNMICGLTRQQLEFGYDIVKDMWEANEETGDNNEDGTLKQ